jgi:hypothetical protein
MTTRSCRMHEAPIHVYVAGRGDRCSGLCVVHNWESTTISCVNDAPQLYLNFKKALV